MKLSAPLSLVACLLLSSAALAQSLVGEWCDGAVLANGRAVAFAGDVDGSGVRRVVIGAPGMPLQSDHGRVSVPGRFWLDADDVGDRLGAAVAGGLDLDGDGHSEVLAGAPGDDDAGPESGSVRALDGDGTEIYMLFGVQAGDELGASLAPVGDVDGDGRGDYLVGAPQPAGGGTGYVWLVSGADGQVLRTHVGLAAGERFGWSLAALGDQDGDGVAEYAVGAPTTLGVGSARVYSGQSGALLRELLGSEAGEAFGYAIGGGSDLDRDGVDELWVGSPEADAGVGTVQAFRVTTGELLWTAEGDGDEPRFGAALVGLRDFDGDGHGDVGVGAPGTFTPEGFAQDPGRAVVLSGADGGLLARAGGGHGSAAAGVALAAGDLQGDGLADLLVGGVMNNDGYGSSACVIAIGRNLARRSATSPAASRLGTSLARVGDLDGDGRPELLIGDPGGADPSGVVTGSARVETPEGKLLFVFHGDALNDRLGEAVASAGDVDLDGFDDLVVGAASRRGELSGRYARVYSGATGDVLYTFGATGSIAFGSVLAGGGDLDGDGCADVLVGGTSFATNQGNLVGFLDTGLVRAYSGRTGALLHELAGGEALGSSLAFLDDVDGDGSDEFAVGVPERFVGAPFFTLGEVELRSGATAAVLGTFTTFYYRIGTDVARIDDIDGDGLSDLAVTSWDAGFWSLGSVHGVSSATLTELWSDERETFYEGLSFGYAVEAGPPGSGSLVVGSPGTNVASGRAIGTVELRDQAGGGMLGGFSGYSGWDYLGYSVAHLGDVDGDGVADFAAGAPTEPSNLAGAEVGQSRVEVVLSGRVRQYSYCPLGPNSSGAAARITAAGSSRVSQNDLGFHVEGVPNNKFGLFLMGADAVQLPFHDGWRCIGSFKRLSPALSTGTGGELDWTADLNVPPAHLITAGSSWSFQLWFRDLPGSLDTSDAVRVAFVP